MKSDRPANAFDRLIVTGTLRSERDIAIAALIEAADSIISVDALQMRPTSSDITRLRRAREAHRTAQAAFDAAKEE